MKHIKARIFGKVIGLQILTIIAMKYLTPILSNYPVLSEDPTFQRQIEAMTHNEQYLALGTIFIITQIIFISIFFRGIFKYIKKDKSKVTLKETEKIRKTCFNIPLKLLIIQTTMEIVMLMMLFSMVNISILLCFKFLLIYLSFFTAEWVISILLLQSDLDKIIESTYTINKKATIPKKKTKFYITLLRSLVPFFLVIIITISLLAYSKIVDLNGETKYYYYKQNIQNMQLDGLSIQEVFDKITSVPLLDNTNYYFVVTNGEKHYATKGKKKAEEITFTDFFIKYAEFFINQTDGRVYEYFGVEEEGYARYITLDNGQRALIGVKYSTTNLQALYYLIGTAGICTVIYFIVLLVWTRNISKNIIRVSDSLSQIAKQYDIEKDVESLPALSNDEIGELVISFNEIRKLTKENVDKIKNSQDMLMERERLATLGQMVGGIAHNLKTPIMSIAGAMEGLQDLIKEYEHSIEDPEVTIEDHHAIAKDMKEWIEKVNSYDAYMADIITTVKGQAVNFNDVTLEEFTIDELLKRVNILMRHELKNALAVLNVDCKVPETLTLKGNVNSLVQIVNNLISNAIQSYNKSAANNSKSLIGKNTPGNEKVINLIIKQKDNRIIISVQDFGSGIPKDVQAKLFKSMITTKGHNGTGLGLFMSYSTIKGHFNGDMNFTSEVGKGTTFNIILPM